MTSVDGVGRTGRDVALDAAQRAFSDAMRTRREVTGWERIPNTSACQMCRDLSGTVLPVSVEPFHHVGCGCGIRPLLTETTDTIFEEEWV